MVSIWFFIGISLLVNGVLICGAGIYEWRNPPPESEQVKLFTLHSGIWWGALMTLIGAGYCYYFKPRRKKA
jgi:hypothetical protein